MFCCDGAAGFALTSEQMDKSQSPLSKSGTPSPSHREALTPGAPGPSTSCLRLVSKAASSADPLGEDEQTKTKIPSVVVCERTVLPPPPLFPLLQPLLPLPLPSPALRSPMSVPPGSYPAHFGVVSHAGLNGELASPGGFGGALTLSPQISAAANAYSRSPMVSRRQTLQNSRTSVLLSAACSPPCSHGCVFSAHLHLYFWYNLGFFLLKCCCVFFVFFWFTFLSRLRMTPGLI